MHTFRKAPWRWFSNPYLVALLIPIACTAAALPTYPHIDAVNAVMIYMLGMSSGALYLGRAASVLCAICGIVCFDYFFVPPRFSLYVADARYLLTFTAMLGIVLVIAQLVARGRAQTQRQLALVAERARLAEAAARAEAEAGNAARRSTLLASISHDLRAPLAAIAGAGGLLAQTQTALDAHRRTVLGQLIESKAQQMTDMLANVLDLMRLEAAPVIRRRWESLEELVSTAIGRKQARLDRWRIGTQIPADLPVVHVDGQLIVQLLTNLLDNAAKYTPPGTSLRLGAQTGDKLVELVVEDDGPGLGGANPQRLLDGFQRGTAATGATGAGIGLAICRVIAELHGGGFRAENASPCGARFILTLPVEGNGCDR